MKNCVEILLQISYICNSPFIHRASRFIIEGNQVGQGWFDLDKSLLADSSDPSVHVPVTGRTGSLIFPGDDQAVGLPSWLFKVTFAFYQQLGNFFSCHSLSKMTKRSLTKTSAILASVDASHLVPCLELLKFSLTWSSWTVGSTSFPPICY